MKHPIQAAPVQRIDFARATLLSGGLSASYNEDYAKMLILKAGLKAIAPGPGGKVGRFVSAVPDLAKAALVYSTPFHVPPMIQQPNSVYQQYLQQTYSNPNRFISMKPFSNKGD